MVKIRITVLKRTINEEFAREYTKITKVPFGIFRYVFAQLFKGNFDKWMEEDSNTVIACCTDGIRPVFYKIERIED
jgi:hypothetical protein